MAAGDDEDPIKVGILVVSTTAAQDPSADATSGLLFQVFADQQGGSGSNSRWTVARRAVVPDEPARIAEAVADFADGDDAVGLLVTTGGTGFAVDDRTPEVRNEPLSPFPRAQPIQVGFVLITDAANDRWSRACWISKPRAWCTPCSRPHYK